MVQHVAPKRTSGIMVVESPVCERPLVCERVLLKLFLTVCPLLMMIYVIFLKDIYGRLTKAESLHPHLLQIKSLSS